MIPATGACCAGGLRALTSAALLHAAEELLLLACCDRRWDTDAADLQRSCRARLGGFQSAKTVQCAHARSSDANPRPLLVRLHPLLVCTVRGVLCPAWVPHPLDAPRLSRRWWCK